MKRWWNTPLVGWLLLFVLAAVPRVAYGLVVMGHPGQGYVGDEMERAGVFLALQGDIANLYSNTSGPSAHVGPLYPLFLASLYRLFGLPDAHGWMAQVVAASLATALGISLLPVLGKRLGFHPAAGWVAGVCLALSPVNLWVESWGGWEQPFALLALLGLVFAFLALHDCLAGPRHGWCREGEAPAEPQITRGSRLGRSLALPFPDLGSLILGIGLLIGASALLSPTLLPAAGLMLLWQLVAHWNRRRALVLGAAAGILLIATACVMPWACRNYAVLGGIVPVRSNFGLELWIGNNPLANGKTFVTFFDDPQRITRQWHPAGSRTERAQLQEVGELAYMREKQQQAWEWIRGHPADFAQLTANRFQFYWFPPLHMWSPNVPLHGLRVLAFNLAGAGAFVGLFYLVMTRHPRRWLLAAAVLGPSLVYMITHVDTRYRYPTFALSVLLGCQVAGVALSGLARQVSRIGGRRRALFQFDSRVKGY